MKEGASWRWGERHGPGKLTGWCFAWVYDFNAGCKFLDIGLIWVIFVYSGDNRGEKESMWRSKFRFGIPHLHHVISVLARAEVYSPKIYSTDSLRPYPVDLPVCCHCVIGIPGEVVERKQEWAIHLSVLEKKKYIWGISESKSLWNRILLKMIIQWTMNSRIILNYSTQETGITMLTTNMLYIEETWWSTSSRIHLC